MKITKLRLENVAGLYVGSNINELEIDFSNAKNKITLIQSQNGKGKSVLISALTPFAGTTSLDERSSLPFIREGKNGYKEIHFLDNSDKYVIKHYFKSTKESHAVKSYFSLNDNELNENGNVSSFLSLVEHHFNTTPDMMRLMRLGSNVNSFISLTPAKRKEYIGKLIEEIDLYLKIYKKINENIRVVKVLAASNNSNRYNCHITDVLLEKDKLSDINKKIKSLEKERDSILIKIDKIKTLEKEHNIDELKRKRQEVISKLKELKEMEEEIKQLDLVKANLDSLVNERNLLVEKRIATQSNINSYRLSIDANLKNIERTETSIKRVTSGSDMQSLIDGINVIKKNLIETPSIVRSFKLPNYSSDEIFKLITKLSSFNQIFNMIISLGNRPIKWYIKLRYEGKSVDLFIKDQIKKLSAITPSDLNKLLAEMFQDDFILTPNCDELFKDCPYYRLSNVVHDLKKDNTELDEETIRYIQVISKNIDNMMNEVDTFRLFKLPSHLDEQLSEKSVLDNLDKKKAFYDLSEFHEYLSLLRGAELYHSQIEKLSEYETRLSMYKESGIDSQLAEIARLESEIKVYHSKIDKLTFEMNDVLSNLNKVDSNISLVSRFIDGMKYKDVMESTLKSTDKILIPLEDSANERMALSQELALTNNAINNNREESKRLENRINEYIKLTKEADVLAKKQNDLTLILDSVSTKKGIPVIYMKTYLGKIQKLANNLLSLIYDDELVLARFQVTQDTFEIPYLKNGVLIPDVKYASQSELAMMTMALSFAISNRASKKYNILLLDEIDAGLDEENRLAFMTMLDRQMQELNAEQVFMISHNLGSMANIATDSIRLDDSAPRSLLQNIIYEK